MSDHTGGYAAYLLRLWQENEGEDAIWRASLESARTGERQGFASLADLCTFLEKQVSHPTQRRSAPAADAEGGEAHS
jgi:hypothetical protein